MCQFDYPIRTERLILRPLLLTDLEELFSYYAQEEVVRYLYMEPKSKAEVHEALQLKINQTNLVEKGDKFTLAVLLTSESKVIGEVHLFLKTPEHKTAEIGYVFNPDYKGHGYASEAAAMMLKIGFEHYNFHRIFARCDARNVASYKVMERLGMRREAHLIQNEFVKGEWTDELEYAILREEWQRKQCAKKQGSG